MRLRLYLHSIFIIQCLPWCLISRYGRRKKCRNHRCSIRYVHHFRSFQSMADAPTSNDKGGGGTSAIFFHARRSKEVQDELTTEKYFTHGTLVRQCHEHRRDRFMRKYRTPLVMLVPLGQKCTLHSLWEQSASLVIHPSAPCRNRYLFTYLRSHRIDDSLPHNCPLSIR